MGGGCSDGFFRGFLRISFGGSKSAFSKKGIEMPSPPPSEF
jgi:hypothetical protein